MESDVSTFSRTLRIHALIAGAGGVVLIFRTPMVAFTAHAEFSGLVVLRLICILLIVSATFAAAIAEISEPIFRQRASLWFLSGHWIAALILIAQYHAILDGQFPTWPAALLLTGVLLLTLWRLEFRRSASRVPLAALRSRYESEIRRAAGREERHRLARDLHDSIKQHIFAIHTSAATAQEALRSKPGAVAQALANVRASARDAITGMDTMLDQLDAAPLSLAGLADSLGRLCETTRLRTGAGVTLHTGALPDDSRVPPGTAEALLRIAQEALSNASRHANAAAVAVRLETEKDMLVLTVQDDGRGFHPAAAASGMGLRNIRSRAAELGGEAVIAASVSGGASVRAAIPFAPHPGGLRVRLLAVAALLATVLLLWATGGSGNSLRTALMAATGGAACLYLALHLLRRPSATRDSTR